jgi:predicted DNA-binding transcriptional regulator AlpA
VKKTNRRELKQPARYLRFNDLFDLGIVRNHPALKRMIEEQGFPTGVWFGNNTHVWDREDVRRWVESRPKCRPTLATEQVAR